MAATIDQGQLEALLAAVTEGTFDAAARTLHVTPSAVSQRIKGLETRVGRVLVTRSKPVVATPSGAVLLRAARQMQALSADVLAQLGDQASGDTVTVPLAVNADSLATWFVQALAGAGPGLTFDLRRADQTRTAELLRDGTVMAAVTASAQAVSGCTVHRLGQMRYRPRASAGFAGHWFADGVTAQALSAAPVVLFDREDPLQDQYLRRRSRRRISPPRCYVPGSGAFVEAVRRGLGWGMVPDLQASGEDPAPLVEFDSRGAIDVPLYWQQWRRTSGALERVSAAVRAHARAALR
ncbi:MAG TPA: LysR family transcriptional regulator ArgP [Solirubrobacteraceae bacterium]|jgi:LysR family transcriptional regulator (chromosome initiation inhibitor)|nr:LysR family transcriptional regulator ArgP [Solirubrobacteraceae bacterium]